MLAYTFHAPDMMGLGCGCTSQKALGCGGGCGCEACSRTPLGSAPLGFDIPGADTIEKIGKGIFYTGVGTALIVVGIFAWRLVDAALPPSR